MTNKNEIAALIQSEISDFCEGLYSSGEPITPEQIQTELMRRIMPLAEVAEAELAALKGDQVPVEYQQRTKPNWDDRHPWSDWEKCSEGTYDDLIKANLEIGDWVHEVRKLFTAPQKPVVLPSRVDAQGIRETFNYLMSQEEADSAANGFNQCLMETKAAIEAAGGIVRNITK